MTGWNSGKVYIYSHVKCGTIVQKIKGKNMAQTNSIIVSIQYYSKTKTFNIYESMDTLNIGISLFK